MVDAETRIIRIGSRRRIERERAPPLATIDDLPRVVTNHRTATSDESHVTVPPPMFNHPP
jgi:hypothetical protein